jgi:hypothetical protein
LEDVCSLVLTQKQEMEVLKRENESLSAQISARSGILSVPTKLSKSAPTPKSPSKTATLSGFPSSPRTFAQTRPPPPHLTHKHPVARAQVSATQFFPETKGRDDDVFGEEQEIEKKFYEPRVALIKKRPRAGAPAA